VLAGDVGGEAVLVLEAVAAGGALHPLHRDVVGDEVLHAFIRCQLLILILKEILFSCPAVQFLALNPSPYVIQIYLSFLLKFKSLNPKL
jgi:hypothetical protein